MASDKKELKKTKKKTKTKVKSEIKRPVGRPSKYKPEFCELVREYLAKGLSKEAMAGVLKVDKTTLYEWDKKYPEFSHALKEGVEASRLFWETIAIEHLVHSKDSKQLNSTNWIFNMKNRFGWTDKKEVEIGRETRDSIKLAYNLEDDYEEENGED